MKAKLLISTPLFSALGRSLGLLIPFVIAWVFGAGVATDAFFLTYSIVIFLVGLFNPMFESVLVPALAEYKDEPRKVTSLSNSFTFVCLPIVLLVAVVIRLVLEPVLVRLSGLDQETSALVAKLFSELILLIVFGVWVASLNSIFYTYKIFWFPAISPLIRSACVILFLLLGYRSMGILSVARGFAVGELLRWVMAVIVLNRRSLWSLEAKWRETYGKVKSFFKHAAFQVAALFAINMVFLTDQWFASWFASGSLSLLSYADRLFHIPYQLFFTGMLQIFFTYWADAYSTQTPEDFRVKSRRDIRNIFFIALLVSGVLYIARTPLVRGVYGFGDFQAEDFRLIASLFGWYILGYAPAVLILLYFRALFVLKKSHVFCIHSWVRMILNIIFNFLFIRIWGLMGIAIATFVVNCVAAILLYRYLKSYWNNLEKGSS